MNCYLLVGGLSSRMGVPKANVTIGGRTFEARVLAAAQGAFDRVIAVERPGGSRRSDVPTLFEEPHEGRAAIFGLARALADAGDSALWLLAIDYP
ncbi:MAG TPA: NTP transferase domain-containing protein, partial [Thermoanaerobaculia bacterium]